MVSQLRARTPQSQCIQEVERKLTSPVILPNHLEHRTQLSRPFYTESLVVLLKISPQEKVGQGDVRKSQVHSPTFEGFISGRFSGRQGDFVRSDIVN